jgi:hypothetical protein
MHKPDLPTFVRFRTLQARGIVDNYVTLTRWIEDCGFPPGRLLGPNCRAWTEEEVAAWLSSRPTDRKVLIEPRKPGRPRKNATKTTAAEDCAA